MRILTKNWQLLRKKTPSARAKAQLAVAEKYEEAGTRLEKAAAFFAQAEQLATAGQWGPLYDLLTPMCWAWRKRRG